MPERGRIMAGRDGLSEPAGFGRLAFSEPGLAAWLERRTDADALRFRRWAQQEVIEPVRRGRAGGGP